MAIAGEVLEQGFKAGMKAFGKKATKAAPIEKLMPRMKSAGKLASDFRGIEDQIAGGIEALRNSPIGKELDDSGRPLLGQQTIHNIEAHWRRQPAMNLDPEIKDTISLANSPNWGEKSEFFDGIRAFDDVDQKVNMQKAAYDKTKGIEPEPPTEVDLKKQTMEDITSGKVKGGQDKMRGLWSWLTGGTDSPKGYKDKGVLPRDRKSGGAKSVLHHAVGLRDLAAPIMAHPSWQTWREGINPIIQATEALGFKFGNHYENLTEVLDVMPDAFRGAEVREAGNQIRSLGGDIHDDTLNDLFGGTKYQPKDVPGEQLELEKSYRDLQRNVAKYGDPEAAGLPKENPYRQEYESTTLKRVKNKEGTFAPVKVKDPKTGEVLKVFVPKTEAENAARFKKTFDILEDFGYDMKNTRKKFRVSKRKIDPTLAIYGPDHKTIHNIIDDVLKKDPKSAIGHLEEISNDPLQMRYIDEESMAKKVVAAAREHETVAYNVLLNRYNKVTQLFSEMYPDGYKGLGETFEELGAEAQRKFFYDNITEIARMGGVRGNTLSKAKALTPIGEVPEGFVNIYGWQSQTAIDPRLGMPRASFNKLKARMADPGDPAGKYHTPGGSVGGDLQRIVND